MDTIARIRRAFYVPGWSVKRICWDLDLSQCARSLPATHRGRRRCSTGPPYHYEIETGNESSRFKTPPDAPPPPNNLHSPGCATPTSSVRRALLVAPMQEGSIFDAFGENSSGIDSSRPRPSSRSSSAKGSSANDEIGLAHRIPDSPFVRIRRKLHYLWRAIARRSAWQRARRLGPKSP